MGKLITPFLYDSLKVSKNMWAETSSWAESFKKDNFLGTPNITSTALITLNPISLDAGQGIQFPTGK